MTRAEARAHRAAARAARNEARRIWAAYPSDPRTGMAIVPEGERAKIQAAIETAADHEAQADQDQEEGQ